MLQSVTLNKVASYKEENQVLEPLKQLNYIYGENGCGKSTIAQFLDCKFNGRTTEKDYSNCSVCHGWAEGQKRKVCIYDADFVSRTIGQPTIEGIFVMGEDAPDLAKKLKEKEAGIVVHSKSITSHNASIAHIEEKKNQEEKEFISYCWEIGKHNLDVFREAYKGCMKPHKKFMEKCALYASREDESKSLDDLIKASNLYFSPDGRPDDIKTLPMLSWTACSSIKGNPILATEIKGKEGTTVAELITALGNNDWVDQGRKYFDGVKCPFCQQGTTVTLKDDLEYYFDETYKQQKEKLRQFSNQFDSEMQILVSNIQGYASFEGEFFKYKEVELLLKTIEAIILTNQSKIARKIKEPSEQVSLEPIEESLKVLAAIITTANTAIADYNTKLSSFDSGKSQLVEDIWVYLGKQTSTTYNAYKKKRDGKDTGIANLKTKISEAETEIGACRRRIVEIGDKLKSISKPANDINNILKQFGFSNFTIEQVDDQARYSIVRDNGTPANNTLSEGEKTFIAFLYFYQMVKGVDPDNSIMDDKIIVFDDPVSSLDSKVLYVVSTLIKKLAKERDGFKIHQMILLTHNVYFFKEVTNQQDAEQARSSYWIVRKTGRYSCIEHHVDNPVRTSYQMLWEEVNRAKDYDSLDVRNTLRRILENYFKMFGGINIWELADKFEGDDQDICYSLLQWSNDGSHSVFDDLYMSQSVEGRDNYLRVFEEIFRKNKHGSHYDMMTRNDVAQEEKAEEAA